MFICFENYNIYLNNAVLSALLYVSFFLEVKLVSTKLFVGNLPWTVNDDVLKSAFESHGKVVSAKVINDRQTGRSKGFGFVEMENESEAAAAIQALNDTQLKGRNIIVSEAKAKKVT